ncbi:CotH kinase family protein, partial [candidate division KSB1 bacterium]|nr:CotH kinase family protein [candidate division KSB1 bacterium]
SVGVRFKGNASYDHPNNKKPLRLGFDEYAPAQRWDGLKSINLNNCYQDPTLMREKLHLDFCREAGVVAPRANYANVYLNGEHWGLYTLVEQIDKTFLDTRFPENDGNLYKSNDGQELPSDLLWYGAAASAYYDRYELKSNEAVNDWSDLVSFLEVLNNSTNLDNALGAKINLSSFYKALAADIMFVNLDSYVNSGRNYYLYHNLRDKKFEWIVWDVNLSFGNFFKGVPGRKDELSVLYVADAASRPLVSKIQQSDKLKQEYLKTLCQMSQDYFSTARLFPQIDSLANAIRPYVYADTRKQFTNAQFETNLTTDVATGLGSGAAGLKSFLTLREANLKAQLADLNVSCAPALKRGDVVINEFMASNDSLIADPQGEYEDWIELYNNTAHDVDLSAMYISDNELRPTKWQFPQNTSIPAHGYLIVWADEDSLQSGLHANFKLSANGESIRLSDTAGAIVDSVHFGPQTANVAMARVPNGTGQFVKQTATFTAHNSGSNAINENAGAQMPEQFRLAQNHPNPFSRSVAPVTTISYELPKAAFVTLKVYDILGKEVVTLVQRQQGAGRYTLRFEAKSLAAGLYLYKLDAGEFVAIKKMVLAK